MNVKIKDKEFSCNLLDDEVAKSIPLPIKGNLSRWGDEVYVLVDFDIKMKDDGKIFEVGDMIYWKSNKTGNRGIAIFFGNTPNSDKPKANDACACRLIGKLEGKNWDISDVKKGDCMELF
ncbi:MAG TPA: cyclophilin-like family protein [Candidatus Nanoarchaeia archaeon]|nr:hypothetical protein [Candidatus Woesearchaeota archaeon]HLC37354.1 cyclophilin-like family protein [Candidatus Nanoarchaeia archaeon]